MNSNLKLNACPLHDPINIDLVVERRLRAVVQGLRGRWWVVMNTSEGGLRWAAIWHGASRKMVLAVAGDPLGFVVRDLRPAAQGLTLKFRTIVDLAEALPTLAAKRASGGSVPAQINFVVAATRH